MSDEQLDHTLQELAAVVRQALDDLAAADRLLDDLSARQERTPVDRCPDIDPRMALISEQVLLVEEARNRHEEIACRLTAWWADVAVCAVLGVIQGRSLTLARVAAANPYGEMGEEALAFLPPISDHDRQLAELAILMDDSWAPGLDPVGGVRFASEVGLRAAFSPSGERRVVEDGFPEGRRRRLWGQVWIRHQIPLLPSSAHIVRSLEAAVAPPASINAIREASEAVEVALAAEIRAWALEEGEEGEGPVMPEDEESASQRRAEIDALWRQARELLPSVASYSQVLTDHLGTIRDARHR
ncbi:hypothetical protein GCM10022252_39350 [Streptosporangium oxazolinicum]|uniref:Uncharacterized protein n=1 Tax=Streptosporangium oxazolinicum TaxID=909287 RepID=A0ABP8AZW3_9ACTN